MDTFRKRMLWHSLLCALSQSQARSSLLIDSTCNSHVATVMWYFGNFGKAPCRATPATCSTSSGSFSSCIVLESKNETMIQVSALFQADRCPLLYFCEFYVDKDSHCHKICAVSYCSRLRRRYKTKSDVRRGFPKI